MQPPKNIQSPARKQTCPHCKVLKPRTAFYHAVDSVAVPGMLCAPCREAMRLRRTRTLHQSPYPKLAARRRAPAPPPAPGRRTCRTCREDLPADVFLSPKAVPHVYCAPCRGTGRDGDNNNKNNDDDDDNKNNSAAATRSDGSGSEQPPSPPPPRMPGCEPVVVFAAAAGGAQMMPCPRCRGDRPVALFVSMRELQSCVGCREQRQLHRTAHKRQRRAAAGLDEVEAGVEEAEEEAAASKRLRLE